MATIDKNGAFMALPMNIKRGNPIPVDTTLVWYSMEELKTYATSGATAYVGQIVTLVDESAGTADVYMISNEAGTLVKLAQTTTTGNIANDVVTLQGQVNALITKVGDAKTGDTPSTGLYAAIDSILGTLGKTTDSASSTGSIYARIAALVSADEALDGRLDVLEGDSSTAGSVAEAKAAADAAQADVDAVKGRMDTAEKDIDALEGRATKLEATHAKDGGNFKTVAQEVEAGIATHAGDYAAKSYEAKVDALVGDDASKSARSIAAEEVAKIVAGANESYDTLKEIADWIKSDTSGAAKMASDIAQNASNIDALEALVGDTAVATQIANAIKEALKNGEVDKYALATDLTALADAVGADDNKGLRARIAANESAISAINDPKTGILKKANDHADGLNTAMDTRVKALEDIDHEHSNKSVLDGITAEKVSAWDSAEQNAKTYSDGQLSAKVGDLGKITEGGADHTVKTYVDAKDRDLANSINTIQGQINGLGDLASKNEVAESDLASALATKLNNKADKATTLDGYGIDNAYTKSQVDSAVSGAQSAAESHADSAVSTAKTELIGVASGDNASTKDSNTIEGAKRYADSKASAAEQNAKTYADGLVGNGSAIDTRVDALEAKHVSGKTVAQEVQDGITSLNLDTTYVKQEPGKRLMTETEGTKLAGISTNANKVEATAKSGKISIDGTEVQIIPDNTVVDATYKHISVTNTSVSDGTTTFTKYDDTALAGRVTTAESDIDALKTGKQDAFSDGSATIASIANDIVTLKAGVKQTDGTVAQGDGADIILAKVAKSGAAADVSIADAGNKITATTVEGALTELATAIANTATSGAVTCEKTTADGVAARYTFKQGGSAIANAVIDIPKDMVVSEGVVKKIDTKPGDFPEDQKFTPGMYIVLTIANTASDKLYIPVNDLIEYVTSGSNNDDMVVVNVSDDHKVTATITDGTITLAKLASAVQTEINKAHKHANKEELDKINTGDVAKWNGEIGALDKAKANESAISAINDPKTGILKKANDHADGLNTAMDTRVTALEDVGSQANVIESIKVEGAGADLAISDKKVTLPLATAMSVGLVKADEASLQVSNGVMSVKAVSTDLITQGTQEFILYGGSAAK